MKRFIFAVLSVVFIITAFSSPSWADMVVPQSISQLAQADVAFMGTCVAANSHLLGEGGILVTTYRFSVQPQDVVKGDVGEIFIFNQWGASKEMSAKLEMPYVIGMPVYEIGKEYTLFLTAPSKIGLRAPIGLGYGKFNITRSDDGRVEAVNDFGNKSLFRDSNKLKGVSKAMSVAGLKGAAADGGPIEFNRLKTIIEQLQ